MEETLLFGADIVRTPCRFHFERYASRRLVDGTGPRVRDIRTQQFGFHLLSHRLTGLERWRIRRHDLQITPAALDDNRADRVRAPREPADFSIGSKVLRGQQFPASLQRFGYSRMSQCDHRQPNDQLKLSRHMAIVAQVAKWR